MDTDKGKSFELSGIRVLTQVEPIRFIKQIPLPKRGGSEKDNYISVISFHHKGEW